ncbi:MAG: hypothetical protein DDT19_02832 [Syntrophomonadaceae bacterium]|nr:hypothetical protein [Bacillota bacterium]
MKKFIHNLMSVLSLIAFTALIFSVFSVLGAEESAPQSEESAPQSEESVPIPQDSVLRAEESVPQSEESVSIPQGFVADKFFYNNLDTIRISNAPAGSFIKIYWLDNPETAENPDPDSRPSNVYATLVNDDGTVNIEAATLPAGRFVFVNTFEPGHCAGFYLSQCRARSDYLGEILLSINP